MKNLISISDLSANQIKDLVYKAIALKEQTAQKQSTPDHRFENKSMAMIFDKSSLRTRLSFEVGMTQFGGHAVYLAPEDIKIGKRESVHDSAIVISSMVDVIVARVSSHESITELARYSTVPVINAMTDLEHPCQALADLQTIYESFGTLEGLKLAYVGDADANVINSIAIAAELLGLELAIAAPKEYSMNPLIVKQVPHVEHYTNPEQAVAGAQVVITDTWISMGKEGESTERLKSLRPYQVTSALMLKADPKAIFLHCLPAYRGKEVTAEVIDGPQSKVFNEAENRLHAQKAVLAELLA